MGASLRVVPSIQAEKTLESSAALWFVITLIGQLFFATYILVNFGLSASVGDYAKWNHSLIHPLGSTGVFGAAVIVMHIALAFVITLGGPAQIILGWLVMSGGSMGLSGSLRGRLLRLHRWNGRIYVVVAVLISAGAIFMTLTQRPILFHAGPLPSALSLIAQDILGLLIIVCAIAAIRAARAHKLDAHRYWALLTFLFVSGVWFQRIGYGFWMVVTGHVAFGGGAPGTTGNLDGWYDLFIDFARFVLPWAGLELFLRARASTDARAKVAMTGVLISAAAVIGIGTVGAAQHMWLPQMLARP